MYIKKDKFEEICKKYPTLILSAGDAEDALRFVEELLEAEADAVKEREPYATASIDRLKAAAYEVYDVGNDVCYEEFGYGDKTVDDVLVDAECKCEEVNKDSLDKSNVEYGKE